MSISKMQCLVLLLTFTLHFEGLDCTAHCAMQAQWCQNVPEIDMHIISPVVMRYGGREKVGNCALYVCVCVYAVVRVEVIGTCDCEGFQNDFLTAVYCMVTLRPPALTHHVTRLPATHTYIHSYIVHSYT